MKKFQSLEGILLIDDDHPVNFIHRKIIENTGIGVAVSAISNVRDALDFLTYWGKYAGTENIARPGLIFLDINTPGLNGWDFLKAYHLLEDHYKARAVIIMQTTSLNPVDREKALKDNGAVDFLIKPLRTDRIIEIVNRYFSPA